MLKRFLVFSLAVCVCMSMSSVAFASNSALSPIGSIENGYLPPDSPFVSAGNGVVPYGGTETWTNGDFVGSFTMYGNNLTPVKTIGKSGDLTLTIYYDSQNDTSVYLTVQFLKANTNQVLSEWKMGPSKDKELGFAVCEGLTKGQKIQVYFRVTDKNGKYNDNQPCWISYSYTIN